MTKADELMINDYVLLYPSLIAIRVSAVHNKKIGYHSVTHKLSWVREVFLRPIPITPEILKKNGFNQESENTWVLREEGDNHSFILEHIFAGIWRATYWKDSITTLQYLHELQHVFKFIKIKKEIKP